jgi:high affinity Mn2+ porin
VTKSLVRKTASRACGGASLDALRAGPGVARAAAYCLGVALAAAPGTTVQAADPSGRSPSAAPAKVPDGGDWTGLYVGGHLGYAMARSDWSATQPGGASDLSGSLDFFRAFDLFKGTGSYLGGFQAGYAYMLASGVVLGAEADVSFPNSLDAAQNLWSPAIRAAYSDAVKMSGTARGRVGYDFGHWLYYATGGLAWTYDQFSRAQQVDIPNGSVPAGTVESSFLGRFGWTVGAGIEAPVAPHWTARFEYLFSQFATAGATFPQGGQRFESDLAMHQVRWGLNYKLGGRGSGEGSFADAPFTGALFAGAPLAMPAPLDAGNWSVHGQTTFVGQYDSPFHAPYRGQSSLAPNIGRQTWDATLYAGLRLWEGAELWIDPELDQGFGLSGTLGVAGFVNGEAYKVGNTYPYLRVPRTFIRQTIDLGGETEKVEPGINQFGGSQTADRLVLSVGKFSVADIFDGNKYAHDPRGDFLNWSIVETGTFDYAAEPWGYTLGTAIEWYRGSWTLRGGLFDLSAEPNTIPLDPRFEQFQWVGEIEHRHELWEQPGKVAVTGFLTRGRMGRYDDAVAVAALTADAPDLAAVRRYASKPGLSLNVEQQVMPNVGLFGRLGWADGNIEPYEFTDIDRTAAVGVAVAGKPWGRPDDTFGLAGAVNGISAAHVAYFNTGGLGILIGDGKLPHPGPEQIIETYYSFPIGSWRATVDYQFIANPAYNRDRGPVSVIGTRLHAQF